MNPVIASHWLETSSIPVPSFKVTRLSDNSVLVHLHSITANFIYYGFRSLAGQVEYRRYFQLWGERLHERSPDVVPLAVLDAINQHFNQAPIGTFYYNIDELGCTPMCAAHARGAIPVLQAYGYSVTLIAEPCSVLCPACHALEALEGE